jgi:hypothetical protein
MSFGDLLDGIGRTLEKEREQMNSLSCSIHSVYSTARKTAAYIEQLESILKRIDAIFKTYQMNSNSKLTVAILNNLLIELQYIKITNDEMDGYLEDMRKEQGVQTHISGKLIGLRKEIDKAVSKATAIINSR